MKNGFALGALLTHVSPGMSALLARGTLMEAASVAYKTPDTAFMRFWVLSVNISEACVSAAGSENKIFKKTKFRSLNIMWLKMIGQSLTTKHIIKE